MTHVEVFSKETWPRMLREAKERLKLPWVPEKSWQ
jgi:hypothetical protein